MKFFGILAVITAILLCIAPASASIVVTGGNINLATWETSGWATDYIYSPPPDQSIGIMEFDVPLGSHTNFTLTYGNGNTVDGWIIYEDAPGFMQAYSEVHLGDSTYSETFTDTGVAVGCMASAVCLDKQIKFSSYGQNTSTDPPQSGLTLYAQGYGVISNQIAFYPVNNLPSNLVNQVSFTSDEPIFLSVSNDYTDMLAGYVTLTTSQAREQGATNALTNLLQYGGSIQNAIGAIFYWIKFFLIDNLVMVVVLYIMGTLGAAVAMEGLKRRPNPINIIVTFFSYQVGMIKGFIFVWSKLIEMLARLVDALMKWL